MKSVCVEVMMATYSKLTLLDHVYFPLHKPYIVSTCTHNIQFFKREDNGEAIPKNAAL